MFHPSSVTSWRSHVGLTNMVDAAELSSCYFDSEFMSISQPKLPKLSISRLFQALKNPVQNTRLFLISRLSMNPQYLRILLSSFGEEDFQRFALNLLCSKCLWLLFPGLALPIRQFSIGYLENSTWLKKSSSDEFCGEDTKQLSNNTPDGVP